MITLFLFLYQLTKSLLYTKEIFLISCLKNRMDIQVFRIALMSYFTDSDEKYYGFEDEIIWYEDSL